MAQIKTKSKLSKTNSDIRRMLPTLTATLEVPEFLEGSHGKVTHKAERFLR